VRFSNMGPLCVSAVLRFGCFLAVTGLQGLAGGQEVNLSIADHCNNYYSPGTFRATVTISSLAKTSMSMELDARIGPSIHLTESMRLKPGETRNVPLDFELPQLEAESTHPLVVIIRNDGKMVAVTSSPLWLAPSSLAFFEQPPTTWPILLLGDAGRQKRVLDAMACRSVVTSGTDENNYWLATFAAGRTTDTLERQVSVLKQKQFFRRGGVLIVLDAGDAQIALPGLNSAVVNAGSPLEPVPWGGFWAAFPKMCGLLDKWGTGLIEETATARVAKRSAWKIADYQRAKPIAVAADKQFGGGSSKNQPACMLWLRLESGGILLNGLPLLDYCRFHPAAGLTIRQMLRWAGEKAGGRNGEERP
jgi:hypothetical protein